jgi:hypothetical protein
MEELEFDPRPQAIRSYLLFAHPETLFSLLHSASTLARQIPRNLIQELPALGFLMGFTNRRCWQMRGQGIYFPYSLLSG